MRQKMKVQWDGNEYNFDFDDLTVAQAKVIKIHCQLTLLSLVEGLKVIDPDALRAAFWLMHAQSGRTCNIDNVDFRIIDFANALRKAQEQEAEASGKEVDPKDE